MNTTLSATLLDQPVWPLSATQMPNARLSWSAYVAAQYPHINHVVRTQPDPVSIAHTHASISPAPRIPAYGVPEPSAPLAWPLPATRMPNAHLSWAQWTAAQAADLAGTGPASDDLERAA